MSKQLSHSPLTVDEGPEAPTTGGSPHPLHLPSLCSGTSHSQPGSWKLPPSLGTSPAATHQQAALRPVTSRATDTGHFWACPIEPSSTAAAFSQTTLVGSGMLSSSFTAVVTGAVALETWSLSLMGRFSKALVPSPISTKWESPGSRCLVRICIIFKNKAGTEETRK